MKNLAKNIISWTAGLAFLGLTSWAFFGDAKERIKFNKEFNNADVFVEYQRIEIAGFDKDKNGKYEKIMIKDSHISDPSYSPVESLYTYYPENKDFFNKYSKIINNSPIKKTKNTLSF